MNSDGQQKENPLYNNKRVGKSVSVFPLKNTRENRMAKKGEGGEQRPPQSWYELCIQRELINNLNWPVQSKIRKNSA